MDARTAEAIKAANPSATIAMVGGHPTARPDETLKLSPAIDIAARKEFDYSMLEVAEGREWSTIGGSSHHKKGGADHKARRPRPPHATAEKTPSVSHRELKQQPQPQLTH